MGQLAQLLVGPLHVLERLGDQRLRVLVVARERPLRQPERDDGVDEPLLRAVVQVADDAAAGRVGLGHQTRPRGLELRAALRVGDGGGDELGERRQAVLGARRQRAPRRSRRRS